MDKNIKHIDELTGITKEMWDAAMPKLDKPLQGKIIITYTPKGNDNFFYDMWKENKNHTQ